MNTTTKIKNKLATIGSAMGFGVSTLPVQADTFSKAAGRVLTAMFNIMTVAGVVFIALGFVGLVRSIANPDQGDPHALGKGLGLLVGGVVMISARTIVETITGKNIAQLGELFSDAPTQ